MIVLFAVAHASQIFSIPLVILQYFCTIPFFPLSVLPHKDCLSNMNNHECIYPDRTPFPDYKYNAVGLPLSAATDKGPEVPGHIMLSKWLNLVLYPPVLGFVKASTLVFMLRIAGHMKGVKRAIYVSEKDAVLQSIVRRPPAFISQFARHLPVKGPYCKVRLTALL